jgi:D-alanyl-D-alanine-carboxypeptidase/D-alanyl-D-alanine-endopeptidase
VNAKDAAARLVERVRARPWGLAAIAVAEDDIAVRVEPGADPMDADSLFQIGSITKTVTGLLFADTVQRGETSPDDTLRNVFGISGAAGAITLAELATHRSGLPRLPANLASDRDPKDPYAGYTPADLLSALDTVEIGEKTYAYSNFGFMTLAAALAKTAGEAVPQLWRERIFVPLGMTRTAAPGPVDNRLPGYAGVEETPWWTTQTPGAGGVGSSADDVARYLHAHVSPPSSPLGAAIELATTIHYEGPPAIGYGWHHAGGSWWHNGATHGFQSFIAFHRPTRTGVAMLANTGDGAPLDTVGAETLTAMVRARS